MNSRELFDSIKVNQIKFDESLKKQNAFLNKLNIIKVGVKDSEQKKWLIISKNFIFLEKRLLIFLGIMEKWFLMQPKNQNKMKIREKDLKY